MRNILCFFADNYNKDPIACYYIGMTYALGYVKIRINTIKAILWFQLGMQICLNIPCAIITTSLGDLYAR